MAQEPLTLYKLILLYMLDKVTFNLTYSQISSFILEKQYTNFITLQQAVSELQEADLINTETLSNRTYFSITDEGHKTLCYFKNRINDAIINEIDTFLRENHTELQNEASITAACYQSNSGEYTAELSALENNAELVNIKLSLPTEDMAETVCSNWYNKNQKIYQFLMQSLL